MSRLSPNFLVKSIEIWRPQAIGDECVAVLVLKSLES